METKGYEFIEKTLRDIKDLAEKSSKDDVTTLDKIDEIRIRTNVDLLLVADEVSRLIIKNQGSKTNEEYLEEVTNALARFIVDDAKMREIMASGDKEAAVKHSNFISDRNKIIYEILTGEKISFAGLRTAQAFKLRRDIQMKIVEQLVILIQESTILSYEALLENAKKIMG